MKNEADAILALNRAWPQIVADCLAVLGSELHYQAMIYHHLRTSGSVPSDQLGMNVKMWISNPVSNLFRKLDQKKHKEYQGGFEPIPDVVLFKPTINGDWRRRNREQTLLQMLVAIEVKASERKGSRLQPGEIRADIEKMAALRAEVIERQGHVYPVMMVIDSAHEARERMTPSAISKSKHFAGEQKIGFMYCSPEQVINTTLE